MRRVFILIWTLFIAAPVYGQTLYEMVPYNFRVGSNTSQCHTPDFCTFRGVKAGIITDPLSSQAPQLMVGVDVLDQASPGGGDISGMIGASLVQEFGTGGTCGANFGVYSTQRVVNSSDITAIFHYYASDVVEAGSTLGISYGLFYVPDAADGAAYTIYTESAVAKIAHAGPARIGATGDPTTGYDLDVQGPLLVNGGVNLGSGPTSTPGATPTATSATATATAVTPTPTPTSTPPHLIKGDVAVDGHIVFIGNATRSISVGPCTKAPCVGKDLNFSAGPGVTAGAGGSVNITSGAGGGLNGSGDITVTSGTGGSNFIATLRRGLFSIGGRFKVFGDLILGIAASGTRPTFGAGCGSTASDALATNNQGRITMSGIGQTGSCVVTFGDGGFTNAPACVAQFSVDGGVAGHGIKTVVETPTTLTINNAVLATGIAQNFVLNDIVKYWCVGRE